MNVGERHKVMDWELLMNETTSTPLRLCLLEVTGSSVFCTEVMASADSCGSNASASFAATRQGLHKQSLHWWQ